MLFRYFITELKEQLDQELGEYQSGFRPWRSCSEQIIILKLVMAYYKKQNKSLLRSFIDLKKVKLALYLYSQTINVKMLKMLRNFELHSELAKS